MGVAQQEHKRAWPPPWMGRKYALTVLYERSFAKMQRSTGTGLAAFGVVLAVVGAILDYAVTVENTSGFNVNTAGIILLIAGIVIFVLGIVVAISGSFRRTTIRQDVRATPQGEYRLEQRDDVGTP